MTTYLVRRLLLLIPTLLGMTMVVFFIMSAAPGDVAEMLISREGEMQAGDRQARIDYLKQRYGLDQPVYVQYGRWLNKVSPIGFRTFPEDVPLPGQTQPATQTAGAGGGPALAHRAGEIDWGWPRFKTPDLGRSFVKNRSVLELLGDALPVTLTLNLLALPLADLLALASGVYAARYRGRMFDMASGFTYLALWSIPTIWAGVMLQGFLTNREYLQWFPTTGLHSQGADAWPFLPWHDGRQWQDGWLLDAAKHLVLPVLCLAYGSFAFVSKLTRGAVLENLSADYVRTARSKGVGEHDVLWYHAFRNSLLPVITVAVSLIPGLLGGSVVIESIFSIPGMGKLAIDAIEFKDHEVVMAVTLAGGFLTLLAYLLADVLYALADPRVSYE